MSTAALALVFAAAVLHAAWNLLLKRVEEKQVVTCWALLTGAVLFLPLVWTGEAVPNEIWPFVIASTLVEVAYFFVLLRAYDIGDFSLVYPFARGLAPALLAVWAVLFLGERLDATGVIGLCLLLVGLMVVAGRRGTLTGRVVRNGRAIRAAFGVAVCISLYSAIDAAAVRLYPPATYAVIVLGLTGLATAPILAVRHGVRGLLHVGRTHRGRIVVIGAFMILAYVLVLHAFTLSNVSYVGAVREVSIVLGAWAGWRWLGEGFGVWRVLGAGLIFTGILVITAAG